MQRRRQIDTVVELDRVDRYLAFLKECLVITPDLEFQSSAVLPNYVKDKKRGLTMTFEENRSRLYLGDALAATFEIYEGDYEDEDDVDKIIIKVGDKVVSYQLYERDQSIDEVIGNITIKSDDYAWLVISVNGEELIEVSGNGELGLDLYGCLFEFTSAFGVYIANSDKEEYGDILIKTDKLQREMFLDDVHVTVQLPELKIKYSGDAIEFVRGDWDRFKVDEKGVVIYGDETKYMRVEGGCKFAEIAGYTFKLAGYIQLLQ